MESCTFASPIGNITVTADNGAVTEISFGGRIPPQPAKNTASGALLDQAHRELEEYFAGKRREFTFPIRAYGTPFREKVWAALRRIPYGETRSYADIARAIGQPKATRAVGGANNKNPLAIVVPCHRVIGADGTMVGYGGGLDIKMKLLELEKRTISKY